MHVCFITRALGFLMAIDLVSVCIILAVAKFAKLWPRQFQARLSLEGGGSGRALSISSQMFKSKED